MPRDYLGWLTEARLSQNQQWYQYRLHRSPIGDAGLHCESVILWESCWGCNVENRQARKSRVLSANVFQICSVLEIPQFHLAWRCGPSKKDVIRSLIGITTYAPLSVMQRFKSSPGTALLITATTRMSTGPPALQAMLAVACAALSTALAAAGTATAAATKKTEEDRSPSDLSARGGSGGRGDGRLTTSRLSAYHRLP